MDNKSSSQERNNGDSAAQTSDLGRESLGPEAAFSPVRQSWSLQAPVLSQEMSDPNLRDVKQIIPSEGAVPHDHLLPETQQQEQEHSIWGQGLISVSTMSVSTTTITTSMSTSPKPMFYMLTAASASPYLTPPEVYPNITNNPATIPDKTISLQSLNLEQAEIQTNSIPLAELFSKPAVGLSFDSNASEGDEDLADASSDSSDFQLADDSDLTKKIMSAFDPMTAKPDEYNFSENDKVLQTDSKKLKPVKSGQVACCNNFCSSQNFNVQFLSKMKTICDMPKADRKQFLLDHLIKQEELGISTQSFQFFGFCVCKKAFISLSGVSNYIVKESCKAFEMGQTVFSNNNSVGMRESEATLGFIIWMKKHALNYGNQAPDEDTIVIPACYMQKDLFQQYVEEAPEPLIASSTFYKLFKERFGPLRLDKDLPHIRISSYSSHSKCDSCIQLEKFQKTCKKQQDLDLVKSMKQRHKWTYQKSYQAIQEKRFQALSDPDNYLNIQGMESHCKAPIFENYQFHIFTRYLSIVAKFA